MVAMASSNQVCAKKCTVTGMHPLLLLLLTVSPALRSSLSVCAGYIANDLCYVHGCM